jgi:hypothetical protein
MYTSITHTPYSEGLCFDCRQRDTHKSSGFYLDLLRIENGNDSFHNMGTCIFHVNIFSHIYYT